MAEYIEKAALEKHLKHRLFECAMNNDGVASKVFAECAENRVPGWLSDAPLADVVPRSETCPYYVHNEHDRGNDGLCRKAGCEVEAVQPVVRGKWERKPDPFGFFDDIPVCSNCGNTTKWRETYLFCPNCGARMDGDADAD